MPTGSQAAVPIMAARASHCITTVLNVRTGDCISLASPAYNQQVFQTLLRQIRSHWRGWQIVLFADKHSAQRANPSRALARQLGIELRWLPTACPKLNPVDHLWRHLKNEVLANLPTPKLNDMIQLAMDYLNQLSPLTRLRKAGVLTEDFWLHDLVS